MYDICGAGYSCNTVIMRAVLLIIICFLSVRCSYAQEEVPPPLPFIASISGTYKGNVPGDDGVIIETELELNYVTDSTGQFSLRDKYKVKGGNDMMSRVKGEWMMEKNVAPGNKADIYIVLNYDRPEQAVYFLRKPDGGLTPLDGDRKPITAATDCTLKKQ